MRTLRPYVILLAVFGVSLLGATAAFAQTGNEGKLVNLLAVDSAEELFVMVLDLMVQIGTILLVLALVLAGFRFVSAQGNGEKITEARKSLTWVVIGGLLLLGAEALSLVIKGTIESL